MTYRSYDYQLGMEISSPLAGYIYKRMVQCWTQASKNNPYTFKLISFLEKSPRGLTARMSENLRAIRTALDVLIKRDVIETYGGSKILQGKQKVINAEYTLYPTPTRE